LASSPLPNFTWTGSATVSVTGGAVTPIVSPIVGLPRGPNTVTQFIAPFGSNQFTPSLTQLSATNYAPIPLPVALQQFLVPQGFRQRIYSFNHPGKTIGPYLTSRGQNNNINTRGIATLRGHVFNRSRFHPQKVYGWTHKAPKLGIVNGIIPLQKEQRQTFDDNLLH
jgi:hypothetical protein